MMARRMLGGILLALPIIAVLIFVTVATGSWWAPLVVVGACALIFGCVGGGFALIFGSFDEEDA